MVNNGFQMKELIKSFPMVFVSSKMDFICKIYACLKLEGKNLKMMTSALMS